MNIEIQRKVRFLKRFWELVIVLSIEESDTFPTIKVRADAKPIRKTSIQKSVRPELEKHVSEIVENVISSGLLSDFLRAFTNTTCIAPKYSSNEYTYNSRNQHTLIGIVRFNLSINRCKKVLEKIDHVRN